MKCDGVGAVVAWKKNPFALPPTDEDEHNNETPDAGVDSSRLDVAVGWEATAEEEEHNMDRERQWRRCIIRSRGERQRRRCTVEGGGT